MGNPNSQADKILEVFKKYEFDNLFIVGDFIDMTYMKRKFFWHKNYLTIIQKILRLSRKGVNVIYVIGNHDGYVRHLFEEGNVNFGGIIMCDEYVHTTAKGMKLYITHGDQFDGFIRVHPFIYWLGDAAYELSIKINKFYNRIRKMFKYDYWSLSAYLKKGVKNAVKFLSEYEKLAEVKLKEKNCDAILMGHTHDPKIIEGKYYNTGDFVESCTYIIEEEDGKLSLHYM